MPFYKISGIGKETNRKRTKRYKAKDEITAKLLAQEEGTIVENIEFEKPEPATERQIKYANDLGLTFPSDININEMSNLISKKVDEDKDAPSWLLSYVLNILPEENGLIITKYIGTKNLFAILINKHSSESNYKELAKILCYSILNDNHNYNWSKPFKEMANSTVIENISELLSKNQQVINSIKRYEPHDYIFLGKSINDDGYESLNNIDRTNAYQITKNLLSENKLLGVKQFRNKSDNNISNSKVAHKKQGCLGSIIIVVLFILVIIF